MQNKVWEQVGCFLNKLRCENVTRETAVEVPGYRDTEQELEEMCETCEEIVRSLPEDQWQTLLEWMAKLEEDIRAEIEQVLNNLSSKVLLIAKRYEHTLGEIEERTEKSRAAVVAALERMGYKW